MQCLYNGMSQWSLTELKPGAEKQVRYRESQCGQFPVFMGR